jgi:glycosyltransferase involved in cell wall biosynthesis
VLVIYSVFYNRESAVAATISSLRIAAPKDAKIIIVDDSSTDGTAINIKLASECDPRVILISNPRNKGFTRSIIDAIAETASLYAAKYIAIHGAGDVSHPDRFERQVAWLENNPCHFFVACRHELLNTKGSIVGQSKFLGECGPSSISKSPQWTHGTVMYRYEHYQMFGGYKAVMKYCQDWDLYGRIFRHGKGYVLPDVLYQKLIFEDGASFSPEKRMYQIKYTLFVKRLQTLPEGRLAEQYIRLETKGLDACMEGMAPLIYMHAKDSFTRLVKVGEYAMAASWMPMLKEMNGGRLAIDVRIINKLANFLSRNPLWGDWISSMATLARKAKS